MNDRPRQRTTGEGALLQPEVRSIPRTHRPAGDVGPTGDFVMLDGEQHYRIANYHRLDPFLISLASDTDLWMFVASGGGLAAGRVDCDGSLFPYDTVDRLHDAHRHSGPITLLRVRRDEDTILWEPFVDGPVDDTRIERNLYKNALGNRLVFEEIDHGLQLAFRYRWCGSDAFGWVRTASLENLDGRPTRITMLDGLRNVLPFGAPTALYQTASNLVDAYRTTEVDARSDLGICALTAGIVDRAEAAEVLRANTVWSRGLDEFDVYLSVEAVADFREGRVPLPERRLNGRRGNYLVGAELDLPAADEIRWHLVADVGLSHARTAALRRRLIDSENICLDVERSLDRADGNLARNVASADGLQKTADTEATVHHFANVLFNNMRGGVFDRNHLVPTGDLADFLRVRNRGVAARADAFLAALPARLAVTDLLAAAADTGDADLERLCHEYLPLHFGRRHGDPSRPWNRFSIRVRDGQGRRALRFEGNWRDIFQNWEALCAVFPGFLPSVIAKFVNASTVDGYNPYRITRDGVDWEKVDPEDPWSNIGYWGDHQVIYLLKLLESLTRHAPGELERLLDRAIFSYANVPYRLKSHAEILEDPHRTIDFDAGLDRAIEADVEALGTDGQLLKEPDGGIRHVTLLEKLLVPVLAKISNLVVGGGIWMNTQRPEWNDANNALVGHGVSVVTLCYLRRYMAFLADLLERASLADVQVSTAVVDWFGRIDRILGDASRLLDGAEFRAEDRRRLLDALGGAFSDYRARVYERGLGGRSAVATTDLRRFCATALRFLDHGITANRRPDGLYNAYVLMAPTDDGRGIDLQPLQEMLEGQVAVISSGLPDEAETVSILEKMYESALYRADQNSFLLYPEKTLPGFLERNAVPPEEVRRIPLLAALLDAGDPTILALDVDGVCRFHGDLRSDRDLAKALDGLMTSPSLTTAVTRDRDAVMALFEQTFAHRAYTGRSGTMYAYEGLGSIYWHMVAKLLLAVQEVRVRAEEGDAPVHVRRSLCDLYYRIRSGLGFRKTVAEYGAFPTDPYSHTPPGGGARQPGMTGQVKEEILTRLGELGVRVEDGIIAFRPILLRPTEFLTRGEPFEFYDASGEAQVLELMAGSLAFTYCQVPVVFRRTDGEAALRVELTDGGVIESEGTRLDPQVSRSVLARDGRVVSIRVDLPDTMLWES